MSKVKHNKGNWLEGTQQNSNTFKKVIIYNLYMIENAFKNRYFKWDYIPHEDLKHKV